MFELRLIRLRGGNFYIILSFHTPTRKLTKDTGTPDYNPLYTASTLFYSDYFVGVLWAHPTTIRTRIFLYFAYLQG